MILFTILMLMAIILVIAAILLVSAFGAGVLIVFGDVIVCLILIIWIIKKLINRKNR